MYRLPLCAECVPPTWLALRLDQGPSSLLPRGTSFGRSVQPRPPFFRRGRRSDLSARGRVPPIPEVPERVLAPNSFKRLHIHAVPSSSMPARPSLDTSPDDPHALLRAACPVSGARQLYPLSNTLVMRAGPNHGNCSFVPRVLSSVMSWIHTSSPAWYSRLWTLPS